MGMTSREGPVISTRLLNKLVAFYAPRQFTNESTQFDMGYEQAKRDLREVLMQSVPGLDEQDRWGATPELNITEPDEPTPTRESYTWARIFGKPS